MKIALNVNIDENGKMNANFDLDQEVTADAQENYAQLLVDVMNNKLTIDGNLVQQQQTLDAEVMKQKQALDAEMVSQKQTQESMLEGHKVFLEHSKELQQGRDAEAKPEGSAKKHGEMSEVHARFLKVMKGD
jgi:hypothetical protein